MNGPRTTSSEAELIAWLRAAQAQQGLGLVGIDGANGSGKSHLARQLAAALDCPLVECDLFIRNGTLAYPDILDLKCLASVVSAAIDRATPVIVEGVMLRLILNAIAQPQALHVYVRHSWPMGSHTHRDLFDPARTEQELIAEENFLCRAAGITDEEPILARELIVYHKQHSPHQRANILFEAVYATAG